MKTTVPGSIGGMKVAIDWPNMWLRGSRLRKRSGKNGLPHFRYFSTSCSIGTMFARMLRCVMSTPFGLGRGPRREDDLGYIVAGDPTAGGGTARSRAGSWARSRALSGQLAMPSGHARRLDVLAHQDKPAPTIARTRRRKSVRRAVVDRDHDDAAQQAAPQRDDPFGPVLAPEDDLVALPDARRMETRGEGRGSRRDLGVRIVPAAEPVVEDEEIAAGRREVAEEVEQRVPGHPPAV